MSKNKKHMRKTRHLKRTKKKKDRKRVPNKKDRGHYLAKERAALIEKRIGGQADLGLPPELLELLPPELRRLI